MSKLLLEKLRELLIQRGPESGMPGSCPAAKLLMVLASLMSVVLGVWAVVVAHRNPRAAKSRSFRGWPTLLGRYPVTRVL
jgi:hypothetical protein